jgi:putative membrane protein
MHMATLFAASAALLVTVGAASAQSSITEKTGVNSALGISPSTPDFVTQVAISDMFEIQSSQLAAERATDEATKTFARQMVADHEKTTSELKGLLGTAGVQVTPPTAMDGAHQKMLDTLQGLNGEDFTKQYHDDQVEAHEDAVSLFDRYADGGDNDALKAWAAKTAPALKHHLDMAKQLDK